MITPESILEESRSALARLRPSETPLARLLREFLWEPLVHLLERLLRLLGTVFGGVDPRIPVVLAGAAALGLLCWLGILIFRRGQTVQRERAEERTARSRPGTLDPAEEEAEAARLAGAGLFAEAIRRLYRAAFLRLHGRSGLPFDPALTPGENLRPYRGRPWFPGMRDFVRRYQAVSFGDEPLDEAGYAEAGALRPPEARP